MRTGARSAQVLESFDDAAAFQALPSDGVRVALRADSGVKGRALRMEFADDTIEAHQGDFIHVPAGAVHRESNPGSEANLAVFSRAGSGTVTVNVEAPAKR